VTASEFSFLALGLVLGVVSGAAIVELIRARPRVPHEVKVTVAHDAIPRRASTLADDAFVGVGPQPARGGPADRRWMETMLPTGSPDRRTTVRFAPAGAGAPTGGSGSDSRPIPVGPGPNPASAPRPAVPSPVPATAIRPAAPATGAAMPARTEPPAASPPAVPPPIRPADRPDGGTPRAESVAVPVSGGDDPVFAALRMAAIGGLVRPDSAADPARPAADPATSLEPDRRSAPTAVGLLEAPVTSDMRDTVVASGPTSSGPPPGGGATRSVAPASTERCAEERRIADERCELATRARSQADAAVDALRQAQRAYDAHQSAASAATSLADPRAIHEAKEAAQGGFRSAVRSAADPDALEAAARDWLTEINRINTDARDAGARAAREHASAAEIGSRLERLSLEADAARIGAENADAACLTARAAVAECDERAATDAATYLVPPEPVRSPVPRLEEDESLGIALVAGGTPRMFRLLRGDRSAMNTVVPALAGEDADARRRWQLQLTGLIEAILADAIEAAYLEFPEEHAFWMQFTRLQNRDITQALSSLGFRFDGLGCWVDGRFPSQRDLSLALGYAGLDPMRIRQWPNEEAMAGLFRDVTVAADEYLAGVAGDLTLGEMVTMLGRRADSLADIWNAWGRIRPLLLEEA